MNLTQPLGPRWILYGLAAVIVVYGIGRWQGVASVADAAAVQNADSLTSARVRSAYHELLTKFSSIEQQHLQSAHAWRRQADSLRQIASRVDTVQLSPDTSLKVTWRQVADAEHQAASQCFVSLTACQQRASTAEARAAGLDSSLAGLLKIHECHVLFIRCPSRTAMFGIGAGLGLVAGLAVHQ